jgi:cytochrome c oxidase subunit 3
VNFFRQLAEKPWVTEPGGAADSHDGAEFALPTAKLGLRVFLTVATVLFSLCIIVYSDRMLFLDWRATPEPWVMWPNTIVLILSSGALQWAWISADRGQISGVRFGLLAGGGLALAFIAGQFLAWQQLAAMGYYADTNPADAFFYLLTALHGLHLLGGLVALGRTADKVWRGFDVARVRLSVELCAIYWHFLLLIWLVLFALLLFT